MKDENKMIETDGVLNVIDLGVEKEGGEGYAKMKDKDVPNKEA